VVFNTALDLKAHVVEEHGGEMSSRDKKDARRVPAEFEFERASVGAGPSGGRRNRNAFGAALTSSETADVQFARARTPEANRRPSPSPPPPDQDPVFAE
jgi:E3 ubiquitin-protein ligase ZNF598